MSIKIVSGGQIGVDQAGLRAARRLNLPTGGWAPHGWLTLAGPNEEYLSAFGLIEHTGSYAARTEANVRDSNATIRIASNWASAGERCTLRAIVKHNKPSTDLTVRKGEVVMLVGELHVFLKMYTVKTLNVAGNSEQTSPGIGRIAEEYLYQELKKYLSSF